MLVVSGRKMRQRVPVEDCSYSAAIGGVYAVVRSAGTNVPASAAAVVAEVKSKTLRIVIAVQLL